MIDEPDTRDMCLESQFPRRKQKAPDSLKAIVLNRTQDIRERLTQKNLSRKQAECWKMVMHKAVFVQKFYIFEQ